MKRDTGRAGGRMQMKKQDVPKNKKADKNRIQYLIESSLIDVLMLTPKPGLVDDYGTGGPEGYPWRII